MFNELTNQELMSVNGGWNWGTVLGGAGLVVACIGVVACTGGIGACSIPLILSAGTAGEIALAGTTAVLSGLGGAAIGYGATH